MLSVLTVSCFIFASYGGVVRTPQALGFRFSQTTVGSKAGNCSYVIDEAGNNRLPSGAVGNPQPLRFNLPFKFLAPEVCQQDNYAVDNLQQLDWANFYQCVTIDGEDEVDRRQYTDEGAVGNCRNARRVDNIQEDDVIDFQCDEFCAAEIEFEEFAERNSSTGDCKSLDPANPLKPDRDLRIRVPLDQCIPYDGDSYQYRCGPPASGVGVCNSDSADDCVSKIALYKWTGVSNCTNGVGVGPSLFAGWVTDPGNACPNAPLGAFFPYYRVEVDCPIQ